MKFIIQKFISLSSVKCIPFFQYYWAVGAVGVVGIAWLIMTQWGDWRWFVFIASLPALVVFLSMKVSILALIINMYEIISEKSSLKLLIRTYAKISIRMKQQRSIMC